ncbi:hypothetical protein [Actinomadura violacea]|uniref:Secreted protein n=1 Tax=Actinomadura violacea TaxID=2819934 RepID=A0ABS3RV55_9ACTN|nr:hypothetical protein [Actinomadura violacea]MBO2460547.1 hypothetical protein [Actinomadura violacea]
MRTVGIAAAMTGFALASGVLTLNAVSASASAPAAPAAHCKAHWKRTGTLMTDKYSKWYTTRPDIAGGGRNIQFHVLSGYTARYQHANCHWGPAHNFPTASKYRLSGAHIGGHTKWYNITSGPRRNYKYVGKCAGWDEVAGWWRAWKC